MPALTTLLVRRALCGAFNETTALKNLAFNYTCHFNRPRFVMLNAGNLFLLPTCSRFCLEFPSMLDSFYSSVVVRWT